ncbi:MAG: hypothetical protein H7A32_06040 [Deltaproteobacteria bacterium]|nr:hypothetical protein [Deltaproteobacteria bacterium]
MQDKGNIDLIKHYLELFSGAFLLKTLFKFSGKATLSKSSSPKILLGCPALSTRQEFIGDKNSRRGHLIIDFENFEKFSEDPDKFLSMFA